jgi:hypothetical protein
MVISWNEKDIAPPVGGGTILLSICILLAAGLLRIMAILFPGESFPQDISNMTSKTKWYKEKHSM